MKYILQIPQFVIENKIKELKNNNENEDIKTFNNNGNDEFLVGYYLF